MSKKMKIIISLCVIGFTIFISTYLIYINNFPNKKQYTDTEDSNVVMSKLKFNNVIKKDTKLVFTIEYSKSEEKVVYTKIAGLDMKNIIGYDEEQLSKEFSDLGFSIKDMNSSEVNLIKVLDRYSPNKYVIGIENIGDEEYIAIFKTDDEGKMFIEDYQNDISDINVEIFKREDIEFLRKGNKQLQYETKASAMEALTEYQS